MSLELRDARPDDRAALFAVFDAVVTTGEGYPEAPPLDEVRFAASWVDPPVVVVATLDGAVVGAYYLKPNFPGRAAHIANAGYVVAASARGRGIGRALVVDSIARAPRAGFDAIMFNLVFESNPARSLYEELGWREIGRIPRGVDGEPAVIYWRDV
ncbi:GNAT family N-acetyltransferase [Actinomarinicola tropica]|uniref:GNAT family N-acetyltransferase n=1 Tax=Actinomarinicola tropica TaxID=2789776 RepID=UPI00189B61D4|nr:GNAT family N-acetyltransferase [Actinomarinicola tropica]